MSPTAMFCPKCHAVATGKTEGLPPPLAGGFDLGRLDRLSSPDNPSPVSLASLPRLSEVEQLLLSDVRQYEVVAQVSVVGEHAASKLRYGILATTAQREPQLRWESASQTCTAFRVAFVGPRGKYTALEAKLARMPCLQARPEVVYNYLRIRAAVADAFDNPDLKPELPTIEECAARCFSEETLVAGARVLDDSVTVAIDELAATGRADIAGARDQTRDLPGGDLYIHEGDHEHSHDHSHRARNAACAMRRTVWNFRVLRSEALALRAAPCSTPSNSSALRAVAAARPPARSGPTSAAAPASQPSPSMPPQPPPPLPRRVRVVSPTSGSAYGERTVPSTSWTRTSHADGTLLAPVPAAPLRSH